MDILVFNGLGQTVKVIADYPFIALPFAAAGKFQVVVGESAQFYLIGQYFVLFISYYFCLSFYPGEKRQYLRFVFLEKIGDIVSFQIGILRLQIPVSGGDKSIETGFVYLEGISFI